MFWDIPVLHLYICVYKNYLREWTCQFSTLVLGTVYTFFLLSWKYESESTAHICQISGICILVVEDVCSGSIHIVICSYNKYMKEMFTDFLFLCERYPFSHFTPPYLTGCTIFIHPSVCIYPVLETSKPDRFFPPSSVPVQILDSTLKTGHHESLNILSHLSCYHLTKKA